MTGISPSLRSALLLSTGLTLFSAAATAGPVTISDSRDTSIATSQGDGQGPGSITVEATGEVDVTDGVAVTIDTSHEVINDGLIRTSGDFEESAILVLTNQGAITSRIENNDQIIVVGPAAGSDLADDEVNNAGIRLLAGNAFTGEIVNADTATISVRGIGSYGIKVDSTLTGSLTNSGIIDVVGAETTAIGVTGTLNGDLIHSGLLDVASDGADGIVLTGALTGGVRFSGSADVGNAAFLETTATGDRSLGSIGLWAANSVGTGILIAGNGVTAIDEQELEADDPAFDTADGDITTLGLGGAVRIGHSLSNPVTNDITIGTVGSGENAYGLINRGVLNSQSTAAESDLTISTLVFEGAEVGGTSYSVNVAGGFYNDGGDIRSTVTDGTAIGIRVGQHADLPAIVNTGDIIVAASDSADAPDIGELGELTGPATAILIEQNGRVGRIENTSTISATTASGTLDARVIWDQSGTLEEVVNSGELLAVIPDGGTGETIAIDTSAGTSSFSLTNNGSISGDVLLGSGNNTISFTDGSLTGRMAMGGGNDQLQAADSVFSRSISFGAGSNTASFINSEINGSITSTGGTLDAVMNGTTWTISTESVSTFRDLSVGGASQLFVEIDGVNNTTGRIDATGAVSIGNTAEIVPVFTSVIAEPTSFDLINAGDLTVDLALNNPVTVSTSYMHEASLRVSPTNANVLQLQVEQKTAEELGLAPVAAAVYTGSTEALAGDSELFTALAQLDNQAEFEGALSQLLPDTSNGWVQAALNTQNLLIGGLSRRLDRINPSRSLGVATTNYWWQNIGHYAIRDANGEYPGYNAWSFGFSTGFDRRFGDTVRAGLGFTQTWSGVDEKSSFDRAQQINSSQLSGYIRAGGRLRHIQGMASYSFDSYNTQRNVEFNDIDRQANASWDGSQYGGAVQAAWGKTFKYVELIPRIGISYLNVERDAYSETDGGNGVNLSVGEQSADSLRGFASVSAESLIYRSDGNILSMWGRLGFMREFSNDSLVYSASFANSDDVFTVLGEDLLTNIASFGAGLTYQSDFFIFAADYDGEIASGYNSHFGGVSIKFRF